MKGKSGSEKCYYLLLPKNKIIQVIALYSATCGKVKMAGSKDNWMKEGACCEEKWMLESST